MQSSYLTRLIPSHRASAVAFIRHVLAAEAKYNIRESGKSVQGFVCGDYITIRAGPR